MLIGDKGIKFFKALRKQINEYSGTSRYNRKYVPILETLYAKYKMELPAGMQKFVELGLIQHPEKNTAKEYKTTAPYEKWKEVWLEHVHHFTCPECRLRVSELKLLGQSEKTYCSNKCRGASADVAETKKNTCMAVYGYAHAQSHPDVKSKTKKSMTRQYGGFTLASPELSAKVKETMVSTYGVDSPLQNKKILDKAMGTKQKLYGGNTFDSPILRPKYEKTMNEFYGASLPLQNKVLKQKATDTLLKKHGVSNARQIPGMTERVRKTCLKKYGDEFPTRTKGVQAKTRSTMQERYGCDYPMQNAESRKKQVISSLRLTSFKIEGRTFEVQSDYEKVATVALAKKHGVNNVHTQFHKEFPSDAYFEMNTFPDLYLDSIDVFIEVKSNWTFMGRPGKHDRALTEGDLEVNKEKARTSAASGNDVRWVIVAPKAKAKFLTLPTDWYDLPSRKLRKMVDDFIAHSVE